MYGEGARAECNKCHASGMSARDITISYPEGTATMAMSSYPSNKQKISEAGLESTVAEKDTAAAALATLGPPMAALGPPMAALEPPRQAAPGPPRPAAP